MRNVLKLESRWSVETPPPHPSHYLFMPPYGWVFAGLPLCHTCVLRCGPRGVSSQGTSEQRKHKGRSHQKGQTPQANMQVSAQVFHTDSRGISLCFHVHVGWRNELFPAMGLGCVIFPPRLGNCRIIPAQSPRARRLCPIQLVQDCHQEQAKDGKLYLIKHSYANVWKCGL